MRRKKIKRRQIVQIIILIVFCILLGFLIRSCANSQTQDKFVIMSTTDMHGKVWDTDIQSGEDSPYNMLAASSIIKEIKSHYDDRTLTYECGNLFQENIYETLGIKETDPGQIPDISPCAIAVDEIKYDGLSLGNTDYNFRYIQDFKNYDYVKDNTNLVCANVYDKNTGKRLYKPYHTKSFKVDGHFLNVGIIGLENTEGIVWSDERNFDNVIFHAPDNPTGDLAVEIKKVQEEIKIADENLDFVIVSMHNGFFDEGEMQNVMFNSSTQEMLENRIKEPLTVGYNTDEQAYRAIRNTTGIDMFICGNDHCDIYSNLTFPNADHSKDVLVVNGASEAVTESVFEAKYNDKLQKHEIKLVKSENIDLSQFDSDITLKNRIAPYTLPYINNYGIKTGEILGDWTINKNNNDYFFEQTDYADLINRAQMWAGETLLSLSNRTVEDVNRKLRIENGEDTYLQFKGDKLVPDMSITDIPGSNAKKEINNGIFDFKDAKALYPDDHYLCAVAATGAEIKEVLEYNAKNKIIVNDDGKGGKTLSVSGDLRTLPIPFGINFHYDLNAAPDQRVIIDGFSNGKQFNPDEVYCVMLNSYIVESHANYIYDKFNWHRVILNQNTTNSGTYVCNVVDIYTTKKTLEYGGVYPTKDCKKDNENPCHWYINY